MRSAQGSWTLRKPATVSVRGVFHHRNGVGPCDRAGFTWRNDRLSAAVVADCLPESGFPFRLGPYTSFTVEHRSIFEKEELDPSLLSKKRGSSNYSLHNLLGFPFHKSLPLRCDTHQFLLLN